jgi:hypothetical protein
MLTTYFTLLTSSLLTSYIAIVEESYVSLQHGKINYIK